MRKRGDGKIQIPAGNDDLDMIQVNVFRPDNEIQDPVIGEDAEEETGIYIPLNDDNDNDICDMNETGSVTNENDVIPVTLSIIPSNTDQGSVKLSTPSGSSKIKLWESANKDTDVFLPKTWNLATEGMPEKFYVEGIQKSGSEKDVTLRLKYTNTVNGTDKTTEDTVRVTVVRLNLGVGVYRILSGLGPANRGHTGLLYKYTGARLRDDIRSETNYWVLEMANEFDDLQERRFYAWRNTVPPGDFWGKYSNSSITNTQRMEIQKNAQILWNDRNNHDYILTDVVDPNWDRSSITTTEGLRCDGVVEACYELTGCEVWGKIVSGSTHYDISYSDTYRDEHNETHEFDIVEWEKNLYPATQCGHESGEKGTSWNTMFTSEPYLYEPNF